MKMDIYPKTIFLYSPQNDVVRLMHALKVAYQGFYQSKSFVVVPKLNSEIPNAKQVIIPQLDYKSIPSLESILSEIPLQLPIQATPTFYSEMEALLSPVSAQLLYKNPHSIQTIWQQKEAKFFGWVMETLPNETNLLGSLEVLITHYGSISSFQFLSNKTKQQAQFMLRADADVSHLAEVILTALLHTKHPPYLESWNKVETIVDFLFTTKPLKQLFPNYQPTLTNKSNYSHIKITNNYLHSLNLPVYESKLKVDDGKVYYQNAEINHFLSDRELKIVIKLIGSPNGFISFDELGDILWTDIQNYSLGAMNKAMQRLRHKLINIGLKQSSLRTIRKYGYKLSLE